MSITITTFTVLQKIALCSYDIYFLIYMISLFIRSTKKYA